MERPKSWNSMGYFCLKNTFLQLRCYIQRIYLTLNSTACVKIHQIPHHFWSPKSFFMTQFLCIFLAQTLLTFYKSSPSKCESSDFPLLALKFTKFFMSFFEQRVSFFSNFASLFSVMKHNSSVPFHLNLYMFWKKGVHQSANFLTFNCSHEN